MSHPDDAPPVNPLPPVVVVLFLAIALPEAAFSLGAQGLIGGPEAIGWRLAAVERFGFSAELFDWMLANGRWMPEHLQRFVTYLFVHVNFTSALFSGVLLLALGKMVGETMGQAAVVAVFVGAGVFGPLFYALALNEAGWIIGATPAIYGLIGGYSYVMWHRLAGTGSRQYQAFTLISLLMGLQLFWGAFVNVGFDWVADPAGFGFGFAVSHLVAPGGIARIVAALRRD